VKTVVGALLLAGAAAAADACEVPADFAPLGRVEAPGVVVVFRTVPPSIPSSAATGRRRSSRASMRRCPSIVTG
jgi:hypothetical protein